jgi:DNA-binding response OmpR family regulator
VTSAILIIETDRDRLALMLPPVKAAGFAVTLADNFEDALALLKSHNFHAVVTAHHLGAHNGLHLVLRARSERAEVIAAVTTPEYDPVLEREAATFEALALVAPWLDAAALISVLKASGVQPA